MSPDNLYAKFLEISHTSAETIDGWFPTWRNTIRIRLKDTSVLFFWYQDEEHWKIETYDSFMEARYNVKQQ